MFAANNQKRYLYRQLDSHEKVRGSDKRRRFAELTRIIREHEACHDIGLFNCFPCFNGCYSGDFLDETTAQWQREFDSLSQEERETIQRDLYGEVGEVIEKTPEFLGKKLQDLSNVIQALPDREKGAYMMAAALDEDNYITSDDYNLMFLRSTNFDAIEAANRLVDFMELKKQLFGDEKLTKRITMEDLSEDDLKSLRAGAGTFCGTDLAGRTVIFQRHQFYHFKKTENLIRAMYYVRMSKLESCIETQKKGLVDILYNVESCPIDNKNENRAAAKAIAKLHSCAPIRLVALHHCHNNFVEREVFRLLMLFLPKRIRMIYHRISGTEQECLFKLKTYGIPIEKLHHAGWYPIGSDDARTDEVVYYLSSECADDDRE